MVYRRCSDSIAGQFDFFAINNMSHGMCMMSADMEIQVSNGKFAEFFGIPATRRIEDVKFTALLRHAARARTISRKDGGRRRRVRRVLAVDGEMTLQIETTGGGVCDLTIKRNANGGWVVVVQDVTEKRQAERVIDQWRATTP